MCRHSALNEYNNNNKKKKDNLSFGTLNTFLVLVLMSESGLLNGHITHSSSYDAISSRLKNVKETGPVQVRLLSNLRFRVAKLFSSYTGLTKSIEHKEQDFCTKVVTNYLYRVRHCPHWSEMNVHFIYRPSFSRPQSPCGLWERTTIPTSFPLCSPIVYIDILQSYTLDWVDLIHLHSPYTHTHSMSSVIRKW